VAGQGFAQYSLTPNATISGRILMSNSFLQLNVSPYALSNLPGGTGIVQAIPNVTFAPGPDDPDARRAANFISALGTYNQRVNEWASFRISYQGFISNRDNRDGPAGPRFQPQFSNSNEFDGRIDTLQARTDFRLGRYNFVTAGYEFEREHYDNHTMDANPNVAMRTDAREILNQNSNAVWFQDQVRLVNDRLQLSLSGRTQNFSLDSPQFLGGTPLYSKVNLPNPPNAYTGDAAIAYFWPSTSTKIRAHVGNGYRVPSLYERFGASFYFGSFSAYGDPRLRPERLLSFDGGFDQYLFSSKVKARVTYFYTKIQEAIVFDSSTIQPSNDPYGRFGGYKTMPGGLARGVEFSVEANPIRSMNLTSSYTYTLANERTSSLVGGYLTSIRIFKNMYTLTATQRLGKRVDANFSFLAASDYIYPLFTGLGSQAFRFPGPRRGDLTVNYNLPLSERRTVRFFARIENIFNQTYFEDGFRTPKAWAVGGIKYLWD
jgi:vitamin B12 transporter